MKRLKVGIDSYCLYPANMMPLEVISWASHNGAEGVGFSGYSENERKYFSRQYLEDLRQLASELGMYLEWGNGQHVPADLETFRPKEILSSNRVAAEEAYRLGTRVVRSCSGGLMRWKKDAPSTESLLRITADELKKQAGVFRDKGVILAIETHFEFTTFELLRLFEMCDAEPNDYLGICLDTMNLLTMLEEPVAATERVLPWIVSTHIKDGGLIFTDDGITTFPAPIGKGIIDIKKIIEMLSGTGRETALSVEDHGGNFFLPVNEAWFMERFPDLPVMEYNTLIEMAEKTALKLKKDELEITDRSDWPVKFKSRVISDIAELKKIRDNVT